MYEVFVTTRGTYPLLGIYYHLGGQVNGLYTAHIPQAQAREIGEFRGTVDLRRDERFRDLKTVRGFLEYERTLKPKVRKGDPACRP